MNSPSSEFGQRAWWLALLLGSVGFVGYFAFWSGSDRRHAPITNREPDPQAPARKSDPTPQAAPPAVKPAVVTESAAPPPLITDPIKPPGSPAPPSTWRGDMPPVASAPVATPRAFEPGQREDVWGQVNAAVGSAADRMMLSGAEKERLLKLERNLFDARDRFAADLEIRTQAIIDFLGKERYAQYLQLREERYWQAIESDNHAVIAAIIARIGLERAWSDQKTAQAQALARPIVERVVRDECVQHTRQIAGLLKPAAPGERMALDAEVLRPFKDAFGADVLQRVIQLKDEDRTPDESVSFHDELGPAGNDRLLRVIFRENPHLRPTGSPQATPPPPLPDSRPVPRGKAPEKSGG